MSLSVGRSVGELVGLSLALVMRFDIAMYRVRFTVCWNQMEGAEVW